ncbi:MAG TPA: methyltransferase [bacterium]|nr:methyltransferase [bacterium]HQG47231.1 methyltransferase [bacterium]HQI48140.1 methyltransferase [bacterium]HQJ65829.1 methyltransferase [bacterium]
MTFILRNILGIPVWTIGLVLAGHERSPLIFSPSLVAETIGWCLNLLGGLIVLLALNALQHRAAMPSMQDQLIQHGLYARLRHPIHGGLLLMLAAFILLRPTRTLALAVALAVVWIAMQSWLEERDLIQRMPAYRDYMKRVPRFLPRWYRPLE